MAPVLIPDIFTFDGTRFRGATLLTGGFPCQPFSHAGKRKGTADDRAIWPQMLRVIAESRPRYVIAENVPGLISIQDGVVFEQVCADLEREGYTVQAFIIPACGKNAPHRRDRIWIVAHGQDDGLLPRPVNADSDAPDAEEVGKQQLGGCIVGCGKDAGGADGLSLQLGGSRCAWDSSSWDIPWIEVATRFCRVDDGLPAWVHSRRVARLKALGNAICWPIAAEICLAIRQAIEEEGEDNEKK